MLKTILEFVEIRTKLASVLPMFIGVFFAMSLNYAFNPLRFLLFFLSLLFIDMTTTGLNNYFDYKKSILKSGYHYDVHNPIGAGKLSLYHSKLLLFAFAGIAIILGLLLVWVTHLLILVMGMVSFIVAFAYALGPLPISRTPFGEVFSGLFMGILIPMISGFVYMPMDDILMVSFRADWLSISFNLLLISKYILVSFPLFFLIANIMLANNICDMDEDLVNERKTLPLVIGQKKALVLFQINYFFNFLSIILAVLLKVISPLALIVLLSAFKTWPLVKTFVKNPSKKTTFVNAVKCFFITGVAYNLAMILNLL